MAEFGDTASGELAAGPPAQRGSPQLPAGAELAGANLYAVLELVPARASSARQYRSIYTRFANALRDELRRAPLVSDLTADAIFARPF